MKNSQYLSSVVPGFVFFGSCLAPAIASAETPANSDFKDAYYHLAQERHLSLPYFTNSGLRYHLAVGCEEKFEKLNVDQSLVLIDGKLRDVVNIAVVMSGLSNQEGWGADCGVEILDIFLDEVSDFPGDPHLRSPVINFIEGKQFVFERKINNPCQVIPKNHAGVLIGDGAFGWQTGSCARDVDLNGHNFSIDSGWGNPLRYSGSISGEGNVTYLGAGERSACCRNNLIFVEGSDPNTYRGTTTVARGMIALAKPSGTNAVSNHLVIEGSGSNIGVAWEASDQISDYGTIEVRSSDGKLKTNGHFEKVDKIVLAAGATIDTGSVEYAVTIVTGSLIYDGNPIAPGRHYSRYDYPAFITGEGYILVEE